MQNADCGECRMRRGAGIVRLSRSCGSSLNVIRFSISACCRNSKIFLKRFNEVMVGCCWTARTPGEGGWISFRCVIVFFFSFFSMLSLNGEINDVVFGVSGIGLLMESVLIVDLYTVKREGGVIYPLSSFEKTCLDRRLEMIEMLTLLLERCLRRICECS